MAQLLNGELGEPMNAPELAKITESVWKYERQHRNWIGGEGSGPWIPRDVCDRLEGTDALTLYICLQFPAISEDGRHCRNTDESFLGESLTV